MVKTCPTLTKPNGPITEFMKSHEQTMSSVTSNQFTMYFMKLILLLFSHLCQHPFPLGFQTKMLYIFSHVHAACPEHQIFLHFSVQDN